MIYWFTSLLKDQIPAFGHKSQPHKLNWAKVPHVLQDIVTFGAAALLPITYNHQHNQSPKGNMWSAIPIALLCMIMNLSEGKQGSGPEGDEVL